ncbi:MAG: tetratricopeptide repeat protein, partial [Desulfobacteraceae bacterium]|nr:tetratricopeptide repeat protein [Desulfobacteraceae bacterium]
MDKRDSGKVFLSYASEDLEKVKEIYSGLTDRQLQVWFDKENLKPGKWLPQVMRAIGTSRYFIICLSQAALRKTGDEPGFQDEELNRAFEIAMAQTDKEFTIVPVRIEDCGRGDNRITPFQQYDLFKDFENDLDFLAVNLGGISLKDAKAKDERSEDEKMSDQLMGKATALYYLGAFDDALKILNSVLILSPDHADAWNNKGVSLGKLGRDQEALKAYDKAIELNPDYANAWYGKGVTLDKLGRDQEALKAFDKAIELNPDDTNAWYGKGLSLGKLGRYQEALKAFDKAIELSPDDAIAWYGKGVA